MPPRKSNVSAVSATTDAEGTPSKDKGDRDGINIEVQNVSLLPSPFPWMPLSCLLTLHKGSLPPQNDGSTPSKRRAPAQHADTQRRNHRYEQRRDGVCELSLSSVCPPSPGSSQTLHPLPAPTKTPSPNRANQTTLSTSRKTIPPSAVLDALHELEFENFVPRVEAELKKFNEVQTGKRNEYRRKVKEKDKSAGGGEGAVNGVGRKDGEGGERAAKRVRRDDAEPSSQHAEEPFHTAPVAEEDTLNEDGDGKPDAVDDAPEKDVAEEEEEAGDGEEGEEEGSEEEEEEEEQEGIDVEGMDQRIMALAEGMSSGDSGESEGSEGSEGEGSD
jgi:hypothetical protein